MMHLKKKDNQFPWLVEVEHHKTLWQLEGHICMHEDSTEHWRNQWQSDVVAVYNERRTTKMAQSLAV